MPANIVVAGWMAGFHLGERGLRIRAARSRSTGRRALAFATREFERLERVEAFEACEFILRNGRCLHAANSN